MRVIRMKEIPMKILNMHLILLLSLGVAGNAFADTFPDFARSGLHLVIETNEVNGYMSDSNHQSGAHIVYKLNGQAFTNQTGGHIQTLAEGFSGSTDKTTPWKVLTELLAAYQGDDIEKIRSLTSDPLFEQYVVSNPEGLSAYREFISRVVGMNVVLGFDDIEGFVAFVTVHLSDSSTDLLGFGFSKVGAEYRLRMCVQDELHKEAWNIFLYLQHHAVSSMLANPYADDDGDGYPNIFEWTHGSDSESSNSVPRTRFWVGSPEYSKIEWGLYKATNGYDVVLISTGTYKECDIQFKGQKLLLISAEGPEKTVIDCEGNGRGFIFNRGETPETVISGFTIKNAFGGDLGGAIYCSNSSPTFVNCIIVSNKANDGAGAGLMSSGAQFKRCRFVQNTASRGGGALCQASSNVVFENCVFMGNTADGKYAGKNGGGGLCAISNSDVSVRNCTIIDNTSDKEGGGIACSPNSVLTAHNSIVWNNHPDQLYLPGEGPELAPGDFLSGPGYEYCPWNTCPGTSWRPFCYYGYESMCVETKSWVNAPFMESGKVYRVQIAGGMYCDFSTTVRSGDLRVSKDSRYEDPSTFYIRPVTSTKGIHVGISRASAECLNTIAVLYGISVHEVKGTNALSEIAFSCVQDSFPGTGNLTNDPLLIQGDYHLAGTNSPCFDRGDFIGAPSEDIDGQARPWWDAVDIGADEYTCWPPRLGLGIGDMTNVILTAGTISNFVVSMVNTGCSPLTFSISVASCSPLFQKHIIDGNVSHPNEVRTADMNADGRMDVLGVSYQDSQMLIWSNAGNGVFSTNIIDSNFGGAWSECSADIDGDGRLDVVGAGRTVNEVAWWKNEGDGSFTKHLVATNFAGAQMVRAVKFNADDYMDILAAGEEENEIAWWENSGGNTFAKHVIAQGFGGARSFCVADVNLDGDNDVIGAAYTDDQIAWWEGDDQSNFIKHVIDSSANGAKDVLAVDFDQDADTDVLAAIQTGGELVWYENDGNENFTKNMIDNNVDGPRRVYVADIDTDGDLDVVSCLYRENSIAWWENDGTQQFRRHTINDSMSFVYDSYVSDMDGDADPDIVGCAYAGGEAAWWENDKSFATNWISCNAVTAVLKPDCITNVSVLLSAVDLGYGSVADGSVMITSNDPQARTNVVRIVVRVRQ